MRRDSLSAGEIQLILVSAVYTALVALLLFGIGIGTMRGMQWLWNTGLAGLAGIPRISGWQSTAILLACAVWLGVRPGNSVRRLMSHQA